MEQFLSLTLKKENQKPHLHLRLTKKYSAHISNLKTMTKTSKITVNEGKNNGPQ